MKGFTVFKPTSYGKAILEGDRLYYLGKYEESIVYWEDVIRQNSNFELAYAQIGKVLLREGKYKEAMEYFKLGNMRGDLILQESGYNKALSEYRSEYLTSNLGTILTAALILITVLIVWQIISSAKKKKKVMIRRYDGEEG
jgi:tetratricopeptide (TPR) repeat protein